MAIHLEDRWHRRSNNATDRTTTRRHGKGPRYRAHFVGNGGTRKTKSFHHRRDAERWLVQTEVAYLLNGHR